MLDPVSVLEVLLVDDVVDTELGTVCEVPDVLDVLETVELVDTEDDVSLMELADLGRLSGDASVVDSEVLV